MNNLLRWVSQKLEILRDENKSREEKREIIRKKIPEELQNMTSQFSLFPQELKDLKSKTGRANIEVIIESLDSLSDKLHKEII